MTRCGMTDRSQQPPTFLGQTSFVGFGPGKWWHYLYILPSCYISSYLPTPQKSLARASTKAGRSFLSAVCRAADASAKKDSEKVFGGLQGFLAPMRARPSTILQPSQAMPSREVSHEDQMSRSFKSKQSSSSLTKTVCLFTRGLPQVAYRKT